VPAPLHDALPIFVPGLYLQVNEGITKLLPGMLIKQRSCLKRWKTSLIMGCCLNKYGIQTISPKKSFIVESIPVLLCHLLGLMQNILNYVPLLMRIGFLICLPLQRNAVYGM